MHGGVIRFHHRPGTFPQVARPATRAKRPRPRRQSVLRTRASPTARSWRHP
ncbi:hypothetical protein [Ornithinimicrobium kibberense]|uniref:hypothetical protein n=1 Tax=Ornithinimicrobium kibberense TaxID=282060 RepID=UPI0036175169